MIKARHLLCPALALALAGFSLTAQAKDKVFALVPKNDEQPVLRPGPRRLQEGRGRDRRDRVLLYRPRRARRRRRAVPDGPGPDRQEGRRDRGLGRQRAGDRQGRGRRQGRRHPVDHLGQRPARPGQGPARDLYRHGQHRDRQGDRQAGDGAQAQRRHLLHPERRPGGGQHERAHQGHAGHPAAGQVDAGRRLPALQQRRLPAVDRADDRHPGQVPEARRDAERRRRAADAAAGLPPAAGQLRGPDQEQRPGAAVRRDDGRADGLPQGGPERRPGRPAAVRDGLPGHVRAERPDRRQGRRPTRSPSAWTSARPRPRTPARRSSGRGAGRSAWSVTCRVPRHRPEPARLPSAAP